MNRLWVIVTSTLLLSVTVSGSELDSLTNKRAAFYEGESLDYVIQPPPGFRMVGQEAIDDGYSFAFVPDSSEYDGSAVLIGVNIFKIQDVTFEEVVTHDTTSMRHHYGDSLIIWEVDSVTIGDADPVKTFYLNDRTRFIPNVMVAYFEGGAEIVIFELIIAEQVLRVTAEESFLACLQFSKVLQRNSIDNR